MQLFKRITCSIFSKQKQGLFSISNQVKDVIKLKGISTQPHIIIDGERIDLKIDDHLANIKIPNIPVILNFYDTNLHMFFPSTPVKRIINESFFIQILGDIYFVANNQPIIKQSKDQFYNETQGSSVLSPMICQTLRQLEHINALDRDTLHNLLIKNLIDRSKEIKSQKVMYKQLLKVVEHKIKIIEQTIKTIEDKLKIKSTKIAKYFTSFLIIEALILHYFIYFNLSWDIMQPVTVIIANIDLLAAYWFFIFKGKNFSPFSLQQHISNARKFKHLKKVGVDVQKYQEYLQIRDYFNMRLGYMTKNPQILLQTADKPIKLLNNQ